MVDLASLDRDYGRLLQYLRGSPAPAARALAVSQFLRYIPAGLQGRTFYVHDLVPAFRDAVADPAFRASDPDVAHAILRCADALRAELDGGAGELDSVREGAARELARLESVPRRGAPGLKHAPPSGLVTGVRIPVIQEIPSFGGAGAAPFGVAEVLQTTVRCRPTSRRLPRIRLLRGDVAAGHDGDRELLEIAERSLAAAEAVPAGEGGSPYPPSFDLGLAPDDPMFRGDSAGLGLAACFVGALKAALSAGGGFRPAGDLAWSGSILSDGRIRDVTPESLGIKVRAAYFAGYRGIVVPQAQVAAARAALPPAAASTGPSPTIGISGSTGGGGGTATGRSGDAPGRANAFTVFGLSHLRELPDSPDLVEPWSIPAHHLVPHLVRRRRQIRSLAILGGLLLACALGVVAASRVLRYRGPHAVIEDWKTVKVVFDGGAPTIYIHLEARVIAADVSERLHCLGQIRPCLVLAVSQNADHPAALLTFDLRPWRLAFAGPEPALCASYEFHESGLAYDPLRGVRGKAYRMKAALVGDFDADQQDEIVTAVCADNGPEVIVSLHDREIRPSLAAVHPGHVERMIAADLDRDRKPEVIATAHHGGSRGAALLVLGAEDFAPTDWTSAAGAAIDLRRQRCTAHFVFPMPAGLEDAGSIDNIGPLVNQGSPLLVPPPDSPTIELSLIAHGGGPPYDDYLVRVGFPPSLIDLTTGDGMRDRARQWLREGRTMIDFASPATLETWGQTFRVASMILWDSIMVAEAAPLPDRRGLGEEVTAAEERGQ